MGWIPAHDARQLESIPLPLRHENPQIYLTSRLHFPLRPVGASSRFFLAILALQDRRNIWVCLHRARAMWYASAITHWMIEPCVAWMEGAITGLSSDLMQFISRRHPLMYH